jgi:hypothetical protein
MGSDGAWFVLFPSWRMAPPQLIEAAVRRISRNAIVRGTGTGPFDVAEGQKSLGIGLDTAQHVLHESGEIATKLGAKEHIKEWIAKCDARFVISYGLPDGVDLLNTIIAASEELRKLTGGAVYDAHNQELLDAPLDILSKEEYGLLHGLEAFANGGPPPPDFQLLHYATSVHITMLTRAHATGEVEIGSVMLDQPRARAMGNAADVREAAKTLTAFGFPRVASPKGAPVPRPTNPPVRVGICSGDIYVGAELPAEHVSLVPAFANAVSAIARLGDPVRRGQEGAAAALVRARDGQWPDGLGIEVRFFADASRSFELALGADGNIVEIERRNQRERKTILGPATAEEKKTIAQAILSAHFPHSHGSMKRAPGPHYRLRVVKSDVQVDVLVDAEEVHKRGAAEAIRLLYAAAVRFGKRPLELPDEPPPAAPAVISAGLTGSAMEIGLLFANNRENVSDVTLLYLDGSVSAGWFASRVELGANVKITLSHHPSAPGARRADMDLDLAKLAGMRISLSSGGDKTFGKAPPSPTPAAPPKATARFAQEVVDLVNGRMSFPAFARWLAEHKALWVPASVVDGGYLPAVTDDRGVSVLRVFTSEGTLDAWIATAGKPAAVMRDTGGAGLFGKMPESIGRVDVDPSAPITLQVHGDMLALLRGVARGVNVERAFAAPNDPNSAPTILEHSFKVVWRPDPTPPKPPAVRNARLVSVPGARGEPLAAAFSAEDAAFAFVNASGGPTAGMTIATMLGRDLFASFQFLGVEGVALNAAGPGARLVLDRDVCARMLAAK